MPEEAVKIRDFPLARSCPFQPADAYTEMRSEPPQKLRLHDGALVWAITRYEDAREALTDPRLSVDENNPLLPYRLNLPNFPGLMSFARYDPPEHTRWRKMVSQEFTVKSVAAMRPKTEALVNELIDAMEAKGSPADLFLDFAAPLACIVVARIFGVPEDEVRPLRDQAVIGMAQTSSVQEASAAGKRINDYLYDIAKRKHAEKDTSCLIGRLAVEYVDTGEIDINGLVNLLRLVLVAGFGASAYQTVLGMLILFKNPDQLAELRADPALMPKAVDEILRYWTVPQDNVIRVATEDLVIGDTKVAEGESVFVALPSANHDETAWDEPWRFDIHRDAKRHMTFSHGIHRCLGAGLANDELELGIGTLIRRLPNLRLAVPEEELDFRYTSVAYGLNSMPVAW